MARGEIVGRDTDGLFLLQPESGALPIIATATKSHRLGGEHRIAGEIYTGFSGAPVEVEGRIVGLIAESRRPSDATSYMIPACTFPNCVARETWDLGGKTVLTIQQIIDVSAQEDDLWAALDLYHRLPDEERYPNDVFINLIKHHLAGDFGPHRPSAYWKAYLFVAKYGQQTVGMLLGYNYNDSRSNFLYIPYLVAWKPPPTNDPKSHNISLPRDISRALIKEFVRVQRGKEDKGRQPIFLTEVDDPREPKVANNPKKQITRRARIELFNTIAIFVNLQLRCLDFKFLQPKLVPWSKEEETQLLILYGVEHPPSSLSKAELLEIITWLYRQLYAANISEDPTEGQEYERYLDQLLKRAAEALPEGIRLLRMEEI